MPNGTIEYALSECQQHVSLGAQRVMKLEGAPTIPKNLIQAHRLEIAPVS